MLQDIRDRAQSWIMWVIVILIIVPFALWGVHQYFGSGGEVAVAEVNGQPIPVRAFQQSLQQQRFRLQSALGRGSDLDEAGEKRLKQATLDRLVEEQVLVDAAIADGMAISDEQLAYLIHGLDVFQVNGQFSREQYERWLRSQGYVPEGFEESFRRSLLVSQLQAGVAGGSFLTDLERRGLMRLQDQTRSFAYLTVSASRYLDEVRVTDEEAAAYYREHQADFLQPEQVDAEYVEVSKQALAAEIGVSEDQLRQRYEAHKGSYAVPEQRRARHVLLRLGEDADPATAEATLARAREIVGRLKAGESFEDLARSLSEDPGSAQAGGDLGFFARGTMVGPFEDAVFTLPVGEIADPVRTSFGVHVIRVDEVRPGSVRPLETVREDLRREIQLEQAEPIFFEQAERLANLAFENPDSLEPAARSLGLSVASTGFFGREGGAGIAAEPKVVTAAFSDEVLKQGHNSEPIELRDARVVVVRQKDYRPAAQRPFDEVRSEVVARLKAREAASRAEATAREALEALGRGEAATEAAKRAGGEWVEVGNAGREATEVDPRILARVFQLRRPEAGQESLGIASLAGGDAVIVALREVRDQEPATVAAADARKTDQAYGRVLYDALVATLREAADVKVFTDRLQ